MGALCDALSSSGITSVNLAENVFGPKAISTLSTRVTWSTAAVTSVDLSGNAISGTTHSKGKGRYGDKVTFDADMSGLELLCKALSSARITTIKMSDCEFGPKAVSTLSTQVTWSTAAVTSVDLSGNRISGTIYEMYDLDLSGIESLCDTISASPIMILK